MSEKSNLRWRLACAMYEIRPPYLREENERALLPPGSGIYINDALREVWHAAFREVLDILDDCSEGPIAEGAGEVEHALSSDSTLTDVRCTCGERYPAWPLFHRHVSRWWAVQGIGGRL